MTQKVFLGFIPSLTMNYCSFHGVRTTTQSYWLYSDPSVMKARVCSGWRFPAHIIIFLFLYYSSSGTIWQFRQKVEHKRFIPVSRVTPAHMKFHTRVTHSLYTYHETYTVRMCCFIFNYILCLFSVYLCLFVFVLIYLCLRVCMSVCPCVCVWCVSVCTCVSISMTQHIYEVRGQLTRISSLFLLHWSLKSSNWIASTFVCWAISTALQGKFDSVSLKVKAQRLLSNDGLIIKDGIQEQVLTEIGKWKLNNSEVFHSYFCL